MFAAETTYTRRLIEVELPIFTVSEHARDSRSVHCRHITTFHIWWACKPCLHAASDLHGNLPSSLHGSIGQVTGQVAQVVAHLDGEMTRQSLQTAVGFADREHFCRAYLLPALTIGLVEMTRPDKPNSRSQRYRITAVGKRLRAHLHDEARP